MAISEHEREDLLRDGRNMPNRGQTIIDEMKALVGFRSHGQASLYGGTDSVFQFNAKNELRRVFWTGQRLAAAAGQLVVLSRDRRGGKVHLIANPIDSSQQAEVVAAWEAWRQRLVDQANELSWQVVEQAPGEFERRFHDWLELPRETVIAQSPEA